MRTPKNLDSLISYLQTPLTPGEVPVLSDPCGRLHEVKFDDHDLENFEAFPELAPELYIDMIYVNYGSQLFPSAKYVGWLDMGS